MSPLRSSTRLHVIQIAFHSDTTVHAFTNTPTCYILQAFQRCRYVQQQAYVLHSTRVSWPSLNDAVTFLNTPPCYTQHKFHYHRSTDTVTFINTLTCYMRLMAIAQRDALRSWTRLHVTYNMRFITIAQRCCYVLQHASMLHTTCVSLSSLNDAATGATFINTLPC